MELVEHGLHYGSSSQLFVVAVADKHDLLLSFHGFALVVAVGDGMG